MSALNARYAVFALASAFLFGASTPLAKALLGELSPVLLAGLLYAGSGLGLALVAFARMKVQAAATPLGPPQFAWLAGSVAAGGVAAPLPLLWGLSRSGPRRPRCCSIWNRSPLS